MTPLTPLNILLSPFVAFAIMVPIAAVLLFHAIVNDLEGDDINGA